MCMTKRTKLCISWFNVVQALCGKSKLVITIGECNVGKSKFKYIPRIMIVGKLRNSCKIKQFEKSGAKLEAL